MKFDHIGIFVSDLTLGDAMLAAIFPIARRSEVFEDDNLQVKVQFLYDTSGICYELVAPFGQNNPVDGVLKARKNVLNHVAYRTGHIDGELARLRDEGAFVLGPPRPAVAFGGKKVVFLITALNFFIELIEE